MAEQTKTNAMRELERQGIPYTPHSIGWDGKNPPDARTAARLLGAEPERVFKTLVTRGAPELITSSMCRGTGSWI